MSPRGIGAETEIAGNSQSAIGMLQGANNSEMSPFKPGFAGNDLHNNMSVDGRTMEIEDHNQNQLNSTTPGLPGVLSQDSEMGQADQLNSANFKGTSEGAGKSA